MKELNIIIHAVISNIDIKTKLNEKHIVLWNKEDMKYDQSPHRNKP